MARIRKTDPQERDRVGDFRYLQLANANYLTFSDGRKDGSVWDVFFF